MKLGQSASARFLFLFLISLGLTLAVACGGSSSPAPSPPSPAPAVEPTSTPPEVVVAPPSISSQVTADGQRVLERVHHLADDIGLRQAGTPSEQQAVDYIAGQLRDFGYSVSIQDFSISNEAGRKASLTVHAVPDRSLDSIPISQSASAKVRAPLVAGGKGSPAELSAVAGKIALIERGELTFEQKVANAENAGAKAVIIFNNAPGNFLGSMGSPSRVPAVSVSQENGISLLDELKRGQEDADVSVDPVGTAISHNVIATPPGKDCETISGGHLDSIVGPGANDNASGTSTVLEIADVLAMNGHMGSNCFVLFGGEEEGLLGSKAFVQSLDNAGRSRLKAMFNYDMVGVGDNGWLLIGNAALQQRAQSIASSLGIDPQLGSLPSNTGSDHASFIQGGIPALMVYRLTDNLLHTPQDVSRRVRPELLEQAAKLGVAMLESFNGGG
jgi:aminopeptidase YwaD